MGRSDSDASRSEGCFPCRNSSTICTHNQPMRIYMKTFVIGSGSAPIATLILTITAAVADEM